MEMEVENNFVKLGSGRYVSSYKVSGTIPKTDNLHVRSGDAAAE